jgi:hypothetical protein
MIRQWTVAGSPALENKIDQMVAGLRSRIGHSFGPDDYTAVLISGGYGRGEGGVELKQGQETLHNNLDLIWVTPQAGKVALIREKLAQEALHFQRNHGVTLDTFVIDEAHLRRLPCLVMLYDMREGHRQLLGQPNYLQKNIAYGVQDILPSDMRNLLVNRGALLLINRWLLRLGKPTPELRKQIVRHAMKAIIGMGDSLLFMRGEYHWSYLEKARRMQLAVDLPLNLRKAYNQASEFRFRPDYQTFDDVDLAVWNESLLEILNQSHQHFESWRLGMSKQSFLWVDYPKQALNHSLISEWNYRGTRLRRIKHFLTNQSFSMQLGAFENIGLRATDSASLLALMFPLVAYELSNKNYLGLVREQLQSQALTSSEILDDYLLAWGSYLDPALLPKMKQWKASMSIQAVAV